MSCRFHCDVMPIVRRSIALLLIVPLSTGAQHATPPAVKPTPAPAAASHGPAPAGARDRSALTCRDSSSPDPQRPVVPETAGPALASFVDPTVRVENAQRVSVRCRSYVGPFASLDASEGPISIGEGTNIQDNVLLSGKLVVLGDNVIVAHGATVIGPAAVGIAKGKPSFIGFNAYVDGAIIEEDAMVGVLARIAPGIVIRSGRKVLPGKFIKTQAEADSAALGKVTQVTDADRKFMEGVLHVNTAFARRYTELYQAAPGQVRGISRDPGETDFNPTADLPTLGGQPTTSPAFNARIIGKVEMRNSVEELTTLIGRNVSIRADEGESFAIGKVTAIQDRVTFHALEHSSIRVGNDLVIGFHAVIHGGEDSGNATPSETKLEDGVAVRDWAVVFRSTIGKGSTIGVRAFVDGSQLAAGTVVPDRAIIIDNKRVGTVEW
jgi:carbonic anhydrase/acetyltransferase-like protein (isoleucine patch superfamily)